MIQNIWKYLYNLQGESSQAYTDEDHQKFDDIFDKLGSTTGFEKVTQYNTTNH